MTLIEIIEEHEHGFLLIKKRFYYLEKIIAELEVSTQGKLYSIRGDVVYQMLSDSYHMLVIDLASIARSMVKRGGFFAKIQSNLNLLNRPTREAIRSSLKESHHANDKYIEDSLLKYTTESFDRIFPDVAPSKRRRPNAQDVQRIRDHFYHLFEEVIHDRDSNRAHRFEKDDRNRDKKTFMSLTQLKNKFEEIETILNDFRMAHTFSQYSANDVNFSNSEKMAKTIVDIILIGDRDFIEYCFGIGPDLNSGNGKGRYTYQYRETYYKNLHSHHEAHTRAQHSRAAAKMRYQGNYTDLKVHHIPINFDLYLTKPIPTDDSYE